MQSLASSGEAERNRLLEGFPDVQLQLGTAADDLAPPTDEIWTGQPRARVAIVDRAANSRVTLSRTVGLERPTVVRIRHRVASAVRVPPLCKKFVPRQALDSA